MPMAALPASRADPPMAPLQPVVVSDSFTKDAILAWFRGEFAAANAIIDALCGHLSQLAAASDYGAVFAAIHRRRLNWIPIIQMQKYHSIADVALELRKVVEAKTEEKGESVVDEGGFDEKGKVEEKVIIENGNENEGVEHEEDDSPNNEITDSEMKLKGLKLLGQNYKNKLRRRARYSLRNYLC